MTVRVGSSRGITVVALFASLIVSLSTSQAIEFAGGTGAPNDPYQIATAQQLIAIGQDPNLQSQCYILITDIDLDPNLGTGDGQGPRVFDAAVLNLTGDAVFDGNDHTIRNLVIEGPVEWYSGYWYDGVGLFGTTETGTTIKNLDLENMQVTGLCNVGGLAGICEGQIINCSAGGQVSGHDAHAGGLVGNAAGRITGCHWSGYVAGEGAVGGIAGDAGRGLIERCTAEGTVVGKHGIGGLAGSGGIVISCRSSGIVTGEDSVGGLLGGAQFHEMPTSDPVLLVLYSSSDAAASGYSQVGGLVGKNGDATIRSCYATGSALAWQQSGALVGINYGVVEACYGTGQATYRYAGGGLVGENHGQIRNCFGLGRLAGNMNMLWGPNGTVTQSYYLVPSSEDSWFDSEGTPLTMAETMDLASFVGWDFYGTWGDGYTDHWFAAPNRFPALSWQSDITGLQAIPYVVGLSTEEAREQLLATGFAVGVTTYAWHRDTEGLLPNHYIDLARNYGIIQ